MDNKLDPLAWIEIHDDEVTAVSLMSQVEERVEKRRQEHGRITREFPTFGHVSSMPEPQTPQIAPDLYHHLRQLNQMSPPDVSAFLVSTAVTRLPIIGRLWQMVRGQFHDLVLFYVNRNAAYNGQVHNHMTSALNELTRLAQQQQQEINDLQAALTASTNKKQDT